MMTPTVVPAVYLAAFSAPVLLKKCQDLLKDTEEKVDSLTGNLLKADTPDYVRRPLQGMRPKADTYASLTVPGGTLVNSSTPTGTAGYSTNFLIQSISETRQEKSQPVPTFGDTFYYFFGEQPTQIQVSAILLNSRDFEWELEWWENYSRYLRGTKLVDSNRKVILQYESTKIHGYINTCSIQKNSMNPMESNLSFSMFVDKRTATTSLYSKVGTHYFNTAGNLAALAAAEAEQPPYSKKLDILTLGETIQYMKDLPDIDDIAGKQAIFGDRLGGFLASAGAKLDSFVDAVTNPVGAIQDLILSKREAELTISSSAAFDLNTGKALAVAASEKLPPIKTKYNYADILGEYVSHPGIGTNSTVNEQFLNEVIYNLTISEVDALAEFNSALGDLGLSIQTPADAPALIPEGGLRGGFEREIERKKEIIQQNIKNGLAYQAQVGLLAARRAIYWTPITPPPPSESEIQTLANDISEV